MSWNFATAVPVCRSGGDENSGLLGRGRDGRAGEVTFDREGEHCNSAPVRRERSSWRCVLELGESRLHALRRDEVALALVAFEPLLEGGRCFLGAAG